MRSSLRGPVLLLILFAVLVVLCAGVAFIVVRLTGGDHWRHDEARGHQWLHRELGLTNDEAARLDRLEGPYRTERAELIAELGRRTKALADLLRARGEYSPEVTAAVHHVHEVHGAIQGLAIAHYFEMLEVLPPDKQARLRALATEALSQPQ